MINNKVWNYNVKSAVSGLFLYGDAVLYAAWQQEQVLQLQSFILIQDVVLDLLQLCSEPIDQLQGPLLCEVLLRVLAQRNLGRRKINNLSLRVLSPYNSLICFQTDQRWTHSIWLGSSQMPCDRHLHTGLADVWERGHDHLHGNSILVCWWWLPHGAGGVGDPGTPVKLKIKESWWSPTSDQSWLMSVLSTCPLLVAACWAVLVKMATASRAHSSSLVLSLLDRPVINHHQLEYTNCTCNISSQYITVATLWLTLWLEDANNSPKLGRSVNPSSDMSLIHAWSSWSSCTWWSDW